MRAGKPPRRWKVPAWKAAALREPRVEEIDGRPLNNSTGGVPGALGVWAQS